LFNLVKIKENYSYWGLSHKSEYAQPQRAQRITQRTQSVANQRYILRVLCEYFESFVVKYIYETAPGNHKQVRNF